MSAIQNLQEPWNGHTNQEVEDFIKSVIPPVVHFYAIGPEEVRKITDIGDETLVSMVDSGVVYAVVHQSNDSTSPIECTGVCVMDRIDHANKILICYDSGRYRSYIFGGGCCGGGCCGGCC